MKFEAVVEPPEPMRGLEVPEHVVDALDAGRRPPVSITINGHVWKSRVAIMRGRYLIGLSTANRTAAGVSTGDKVVVDLQLDTVPRTVVPPTELASALAAQPLAAARFDALSYSKRRMIVHHIERAATPETRTRRAAKAVDDLISDDGSSPARRTRGQ